MWSLDLSIHYAQGRSEICRRLRAVLLYLEHPQTGLCAAWAMFSVFVLNNKWIFCITVGSGHCKFDEY